MGKALLILVMGGSAVLARQLYNTTETETRTNAEQTSYQEEVIAREIAASAFNVAMGEIRSFGEDVKTGAHTFNGSAGKQSGTYADGRFAGGSYETYAELTSGHSVQFAPPSAFTMAAAWSGGVACATTGTLVHCGLRPWPARASGTAPLTTARSPS